MQGWYSNRKEQPCGGQERKTSAYPRTCQPGLCRGAVGDRVVKSRTTLSVTALNVALIKSMGSQIILRKCTYRKSEFGH